MTSPVARSVITGPWPKSTWVVSATAKSSMTVAAGVTGAACCRKRTLCTLTAKPWMRASAWRMVVTWMPCACQPRISSRTARR